jgi:hypothetical protein
MADSELRQRKPKAAGDQPTKKSAAKAIKDEDEASSKLDIFRILTFLFLVSCGLSYVITGGDSWFWGSKNKPNYLRVDWWKARLVSGMNTHGTGSLHRLPPMSSSSSQE